MVIAWVLDLLFSLMVMVIERRANLFFDAMKMDFEPVLKARNIFDKIRGKEVEEEIVSTKSRDTLNSLKEEFKVMKAQQKLDKKAAKAFMGELSVKDIRYIPYRSIGKKQGVLLAVQIDKMCVYQDTEVWIEKPLIAISEEAISASREYEIILNPNL
jgi:hypothetical protein